MTAETDQYGLDRRPDPGRAVHHAGRTGASAATSAVACRNSSSRPRVPSWRQRFGCCVQGSLQQWVGHLIAVEDVQVDVDDTQITVTVVYTVRSTGDRRTDQFTTAGAA